MDWIYPFIMGCAVATGWVVSRRTQRGMGLATGPMSSSGERQWFIVSRWQEYAGEGRANLLRVLGIASFYAVELTNRWFEVVDANFHLAVTALAVAWTMLALGVYFCLRYRIFPRWLKFVSTGGDVLFLTCILLLANGPASPLVIGYFLIMALAALRFSLALIWFATGASLLGYLFLLGYARWFAGRSDMIVPRYHQVIFLVGLVLSGVVLGQVVRRVRALAQDYARRLEEAEAKKIP